jgi:DNA-binding ferritin-like protein
MTAIDTSAESLASAGNQLVSAAATMNEIADALKTNTSNDLATVLKQLVSGLEEIQKISAEQVRISKTPFTITLEKKT